MRRPNLPDVPEDTRPIGSLLFADPSAAVFPRAIHTFNDPRSPDAKGEQSGVRTVTARELSYFDPKRKTED